PDRILLSECCRKTGSSSAFQKNAVCLSLLSFHISGNFLDFFHHTIYFIVSCPPNVHPKHPENEKMRRQISAGPDDRIVIDPAGRY
ncbi:MAG: hypothetical protein IKE25_12150, partial [Clostridia bacterium]|nr:hypothetical protein [Clostridia bacterium]